MSIIHIRLLHVSTVRCFLLSSIVSTVYLLFFSEYAESGGWEFLLSGAVLVSVFVLMHFLLKPIWRYIGWNIPLYLLCFAISITHIVVVAGNIAAHNEFFWRVTFPSVEIGVLVTVGFLLQRIALMKASST